MGSAEILLIALPFLMVVMGYAVGKTVEVRHLKSLAAREAETSGIMLSDVKTPQTVDGVRAELVIGEAVIGADYFKLFAAGLRRLVGGEIRSFQTLMGRARREAILRMKEDAIRLGAVEICNIRVDTSNVLALRNNNKSGAAAEAVAYGTAIIPRTS
jgi:uncharacterized protein YbjQ (UPF0145 family)